MLRGTKAAAIKPKARIERPRLAKVGWLRTYARFLARPAPFAISRQAPNRYRDVRSVPPERLTNTSSSAVSAVAIAKPYVWAIRVAGDSSCVGSISVLLQCPKKWSQMRQQTTERRLFGFQRRLRHRTTGCETRSDSKSSVRNACA